MPRNASGTYTLPELPFVTGNTILSAPVNNDFSDIATALTQSLATTGVSTMTGPIKAADGAQATPSYTFGSFTKTGFYLSGADQFKWVANGVVGATFNGDASFIFHGVLTATSAISTFSDIHTTDLTLTGNSTINNIAISGTATKGGNPIDAFPSGTQMTFMQTSAPTGWTKNTTGTDDRALRVTSGAASGGGGIGFNSVFVSGYNANNHTLSVNEMPSHSHTGTGNFWMSGVGTNSPTAGTGMVQQGSTAANGGGLGHNHTVDINVLYLDVIVAFKN